MRDPGPGNDTTLSAPEDTGDGADAPTTELPRVGQKIDRFEIVGRLGEGGMGVVLAAYDPVLDRDVALKLLRPHLSARRNADKSRLRLLREARAMAKVSHANVIAVYEAGTVAEHVFVAMELIDGQTLRDWREEARTWREVLAHYVAAGRGLAAAHAAGLVHRDFKPENVLVGKDGRVLVTDFGLVATTGSPSSDGLSSGSASGSADGEPDIASPDAPTSPSRRPIGADVPITLAGQVMGTPLYMAPEQHRGEATDSRSDQFAFSVALYRALYGVAPFCTESVLEVARGKAKPAPPPADTDVPGWVHAIVERGLSSDKDARFPTMGAMLDALERDPVAARARLIRRVAGAGGIAAAGAIAAFLLVPSTTAPAPCAGAARELTGVWDDDMRATVRAAALATNQTYAADTIERVAHVLDDYAAAWTTMHTESCRATRVAGTQSDEMLDLRSACLAHKRHHLAALTAQLGSLTTAAALEAAVPAAHALPPVADCADAQALRSAVPLPADANVRAQIDALHRVIADAETRDALGDYPGALAIAQRAAADARALGYAHTTAEALYALGWVQYHTADYPSAEASLREAIVAAAEAKHDAVHAMAWNGLMWVLLGADVPDRALELATAAEAVVVRADRPTLSASLQNVLGSLTERKGDVAKSLTHHQRALELFERASAADSPDLAATLLNVGAGLDAVGRRDEAAQVLERSLAMCLRLFGPSHPSTGKAHNNLGISLQQQGRYAESEPHFVAALAIFRAVYGDAHPSVAGGFNNVGTTFRQQGKYVEAQSHFEQAVAILRARDGQDASSLPAPLNNLGAVAALRGDFQASRAFHAEALAIATAQYGDKHPQTALSMAMGAISLEVEGAHAEALVQFEQVRAVWEGTLGAQHPLLAFPLTGIGQCQLALGKPRVALAPLERALGIRRAAPGEPEDLADTLFALARASWDTGDRARAHNLATEARATFATVKGIRQRDTALVDAWLADRPAP